MKELFKDELFESEQIQYMQRRKKQNESHEESINLLEYDDPIMQFNEEAEQE